MPSTASEQYMRSWGSLLSQLAAVLARGRLRRTFCEWRLLCRERWWKNQCQLREREVGLLETKVRGYERRPCQLLRKRRLRALLMQWWVLAGATAGCVAGT